MYYVKIRHTYGDGSPFYKIYAGTYQHYKHIYVEEAYTLKDPRIKYYKHKKSAENLIQKINNGLIELIGRGVAELGVKE